MMIDINASFQFCKNITARRPIKVKVSLKRVNIALLSRLVICVTSYVRLEINLPECFLSIICVSVLIKEFTMSN